MKYYFFSMAISRIKEQTIFRSGVSRLHPFFEIANLNSPNFIKGCVKTIHTLIQYQEITESEYLNHKELYKKDIL